MKRTYGRSENQMRPLSIAYNLFEYADGSVFYQLGKTKVLCSVTLQHGVPHFLRGTQTGWLKSQYAMLPMSTQNRIEREINLPKRNGRFMEISRLIGRSLRSILNLKVLGERTIIVDCDILQADGGTRTACISAAFLAIKTAYRKWQEQGLVPDCLITQDLAAISVGMIGNTPVLDPDFSEDSNGAGDFNFVLTKSGDIVEMQGSAEQRPLSWDIICQMKSLAEIGVQSILDKAKMSDNVFFNIDHMTDTYTESTI